MNGKDLICFQLEARVLNRQLCRSWRKLLNKYADRIETETDAIEVSLAKWKMIASFSEEYCGYCMLYGGCSKCSILAECEEVLNTAPKDVIKMLKEKREEEQ